VAINGAKQRDGCAMVMNRTYAAKPRQSILEPERLEVQQQSIVIDSEYSALLRLAFFPDTNFQFQKKGKHLLLPKIHRI
jgi:hypothetical protein